MEMRRVRREESPTDRDRVRLTAELALDAEPGVLREPWFEIPLDYTNEISESGNAWLACLLALSARRGETLRLGLPVDAQLLAGARELLRIWQCWYPDMRVVSIEADIDDRASGAVGERAAAMFSGGVDSFFTALDDAPAETAGGSIRVDELISIVGFGVRARAHARDVSATVRAAAMTLGKPLVVVHTNVSADSPPGYPWELSHSGVLAASALLLERRYARVLIPSTHGYAFLAPGGSHPLTDPLFSTTRMQVIHHGSAFLRAAKLERIADREVVQAALQVCAVRPDRNCGRCRKCYCTMVHLDVLGLLPRYRDVFPVDGYRAGAVASIDAPEWDVRSYLECVERRATERGRRDVAEAIRRSFRRTAWRRRGRRLRALAASGLRELLGCR